VLDLRVNVRLTWYNPEKTILMVYYPDGWTWEDFDAAFERGREMLASVEHGVYVIHHSESGFQRFPSGSALTYMKRTSDARPKNLRTSLIVAPYYASNRFLSMLFPILPANKERVLNAAVNSLEEALAQIKEALAG
jgi:hypothetical protein